MKKYMSALVIILALMNSCKSQNKNALTKAQQDSLNFVAQIRAFGAHRDSLSKKIGYKPEKVTLTDVASCYSYLNGKYYSNTNGSIEFDIDSHTAIYKGMYNDNYSTKVNVNIRLGGISYATITLIDPAGVRARLPIYNLTQDGALSDETAKMDEDYLRAKVNKTASANNQSAAPALKIDTLTLTAGGGSPMQGMFLYFADKNQKQILADGKIDSCYAGNTKAPLIIGNQPPLRVDLKFLNKRFQVTYQSDSITTPNDQILPGLNISKLVLIK